MPTSKFPDDAQMTEQQLREREHFLHRMTEVTLGVLQVFDLQKQRSVYMNCTVASVLGYRPAEIDELGDSVAQTLMHPDDLARFPAHLERVRSLRDDRVADIDFFLHGGLVVTMPATPLVRTCRFV